MAPYAAWFDQMKISAAELGWGGMARALLPPNENVYIRNTDWNGTSWIDAGNPTLDMAVPVRCPYSVILKVQDIEFCEPSGVSAVFVAHSAGTEASGCKITASGVHPVQKYRFGVRYIFRPDLSVGPGTGPLLVKNNEMVVNGSS